MNSAQEARTELNRTRRIAAHTQQVQKDAKKELKVPHGTGRWLRREKARSQYSSSQHPAGAKFGDFWRASYVKH